MAPLPFADLHSLASHLRQELEAKKAVLLYAYNGTGKTRLSMEFKDLGRVDDKRDTLYFNAFTEDLFSWDNDFEGDVERRLLINTVSHFFDGLFELEMDNRIRRLLNRYVDFDFVIDVEAQVVRFSRTVLVDSLEGGEPTTEVVDNIKVSRGEENVFIWCFFLAIVQLAMDPQIDAYRWVKYVYIDDPISSLDENNAVMVAHHLAQIFSAESSGLKLVVSTHHVLFFNVLCHETKKPRQYLLNRGPEAKGFTLQKTDETPFLYHLASLVELHEAEKSGRLFTHHFNMLRRLMEQTAAFLGYEDWEDCIHVEDDDPDQSYYKRVIDLMSHGDYSLYEPREMLQDNKDVFGSVFRQFLNRHPFNRDLISEPPTRGETT